MVMMSFFGIEGRAELRTIILLGHPWGTLATVSDLRVSPLSQKSRFYAGSETPESPWTVRDPHRTHSSCARQRFESVRRLHIYQRFPHDLGDDMPPSRGQGEPALTTRAGEERFLRLPPPDGMVRSTSLRP